MIDRKEGSVERGRKGKGREKEEGMGGTVFGP